ncbi:MAG: type II toxin-antitoxin system HicB family antitoxin [Bacteroidales bacterium]|jgi:predicted RNase H-like HicB family nuclease|nr:type II toxin-antitoxin system HicB family antitoxin [Bacteroidales bacterium]
MEYTAVFQKMENGWYFAQCEQMPNAVTQGRTIAEAKENLQEVIALLLEIQKEECEARNSGKKLIHRKIAQIAML